MSENIENFTNYCEGEHCDCGHEHEHENEYHEDGIDNSEHILDMLEMAEMSYDNIKDNTDVVFSTLKQLEGKDEDFLDVLRINCSAILEVEKSIKTTYDNFKALKDNILSSYDNNEWKNKVPLLEEYLTVLQKSEEISNQCYEKFIRLLDKE